MDVSSLYTNILHQEVIKTLEKHLKITAYQANVNIKAIKTTMILINNDDNNI